MKNDIIEVNNCSITGDDDRFTYIDLGYMPLVNNLSDSRHESFNVPRYKLAVQYFKKSKLSCLTENINPNLMFSEYSYKSGVIESYAKHCEEMFSFVDYYLNLSDGDSVLDVGGNDGTLLKTFLKKKPNLDVLNVDASINISKLSRENGIPTYTGFWGVETSKKINKKFKLITSTNVFQHTPPISDFVGAVSMSLDDYGIWCLEFPYWKTNMETKQYDQIYHEHVYFYLLNPIVSLLKKFKLHIIKVIPQNIHGGSLRLLISHEGEIGSSWQPCTSVKSFIDDEIELNDEYYLNWGTDVKLHINNCRNFLLKLKNEGNNIVGFGAAAKGCVFLNSANIDYKILDAVIDDTDLKQGKYIPGTGIQIFSRDYFNDNTVDYILILAHNFKDYIIPNLKDNGYKGKFIIMFPDIKII